MLFVEAGREVVVVESRYLLSYSQYLLMYAVVNRLVLTDSLLFNSF